MTTDSQQTVTIPHSLTDLLSVTANPLLQNYSEAELMSLVQELRQLATSPATLSATLSSSSEKIKPTKVTSKRQQLLASL